MLRSDIDNIRKAPEFCKKFTAMNKSTGSAVIPYNSKQFGLSVVGELAQCATENAVPGATNQQSSSYSDQKEKQWVKNTPIPYIVRNNDLTLREFLIF
jgi:hypothetical protein